MSPNGAATALEICRSALPPATSRAEPGGGLTLEELPGNITVDVASHRVHFDHDRKLWYCDIEIEAGHSYYPFVRLALARYQPHSVPHTHLSRVVMTDYIQVAPRRTAELVLSPGTAAITVRGYSGRNHVADLPFGIFVDPILSGPGNTPNTTMRAVLERRVAGVPGDLGWERVGQGLTCRPAHRGST
jgi:hypothetical protein